jgi:hypothetical protein
MGLALLCGVLGLVAALQPAAVRGSSPVLWSRALKKAAPELQEAGTQPSNNPINFIKSTTTEGLPNGTWAIVYQEVPESQLAFGSIFPGFPDFVLSRHRLAQVGEMTFEEQHTVFHVSCKSNASMMIIGRRSPSRQPSLESKGYSWSYLACRVGQSLINSITYESIEESFA